MANAFVFSCANAAAQRHFADSVESGVQIGRIASVVGNAEIIERLYAASEDGLSYCWAGKSGGQDQIYWERMAIGDLILGYRQASIVSASFFIAKLKSAELAKLIWPDAIDPPYDLIYFFTKPEFFNQPIAGLQDYFAKVYQGLRRLPTSDKMVKDFGSFANFVREALGANAGDGPTSEGDADILQSLTIEGRRLLKQHWKIERSNSIVAKAKALWLNRDCELRCESCDFSFLETYGKYGEGFIEAHHRIPLGHSSKSGPITTQIEDFAALCSNCHRIIHRANISINELKELIRKNKRG